MQNLRFCCSHLLSVLVLTHTIMNMNCLRVKQDLKSLQRKLIARFSQEFDLCTIVAGTLPNIGSSRVATRTSCNNRDVAIGCKYFISVLKILSCLSILKECEQQLLQAIHTRKRNNACICAYVTFNRVSFF